MTIFPLSYAGLYTDRTPAAFLELEMVGAVVLAITVMLSGLLADRVGRRNLLGACAVLIGIYALFTPMLLGGDQTGHTIFILVGFGLLGLSFGQAAGAVASNFSSHNRYTGSAITSDLAWLIGAGFAPLVALAGVIGSASGPWRSTSFRASVCTLGALAINKRLDIRDT